MAPQKIYSFDEVEKHNKQDDCWIILFGKVFNVTRFLEHHPGGKEMLLMATGKDATDEFDGLPHSPEAREKMKEFYIGEIDPNTFPKLISSTTEIEALSSQNDAASSNFNFRNILPLLVVGVAIYLFVFN